MQETFGDGGNVGACFIMRLASHWISSWIVCSLGGGGGGGGERGGV